MTDKKYTDKDIISSLEVIATTSNCNECKIRNCKWGTCNCSQITANAALELINRQKSEIERLRAKIETRTQEKLSLGRIYTQKLKTVKYEAYKEFTEKLKEEFLNLQYNANTDRKNIKIEELKEQMDWLLHTVAIETVENLLKETVGE